MQSALINSVKALYKYQHLVFLFFTKLWQDDTRSFPSYIASFEIVYIGP